MDNLQDKYIYHKNNGSLHLFLDDITQNGKYNVKIPFIDRSNINEKPIWIIVDPKDVESICKKNVKKLPNLASYVGDSIISTTDNLHWKNQRNDYQEAFDPTFVLPVLPFSIQRAQIANEYLSNSFSSLFNLNEFYSTKLRLITIINVWT